ncbi:hypothetical protein [Scrofimicrobium sp. R131]|uniref:Uncharacterized protein n=1 Tax=Scrofimicrobium appendicitidis TaxID=3079930 RepID=A0AAU7V6J8_9ACTO
MTQPSRFIKRRPGGAMNSAIGPNGSPGWTDWGDLESVREYAVILESQIRQGDRWAAEDLVKFQARVAELEADPAKPHRKRLAELLEWAAQGQDVSAAIADAERNLAEAQRRQADTSNTH